MLAAECLHGVGIPATVQAQAGTEMRTAATEDLQKVLEQVIVARRRIGALLQPGPEDATNLLGGMLADPTAVRPFPTSCVLLRTDLRIHVEALSVGRVEESEVGARFHRPVPVERG